MVQVPLLTERQRTDLERLLSVFDQKLRTDSRHVLEVDETRIPAEYGPVLRRLQRAAVSRELEQSMCMEDEVAGEWMRMERDIVQQKEALAQQDEALAQQDEALAQWDETLAQWDETLAQQKEALERQQAEIEALRRRLDRQGR